MRQLRTIITAQTAVIELTLPRPFPTLTVMGSNYIHLHVDWPSFRWDEAGLADIIAMSEAVAGGPEQLSLNPFLLAYLEPITPLQHSNEVMRKVLMMADKRLPFVYSPGGADGASAPVT